MRMTIDDTVQREADSVAWSLMNWAVFTEACVDGLGVRPGILTLKLRFSTVVS